jgi:hypothetical protein
MLRWTGPLNKRLYLRSAHGVRSLKNDFRLIRFERAIRCVLELVRHEKEAHTASEVKHIQQSAGYA